MELAGLEVALGESMSEQGVNAKAEDTAVHDCRLSAHCPLRLH